MKKILVLDLDGTLTNNEKKITPKTKQALMEMQEKGHMLVLASGRPTPGVALVAEELQMEKYNGCILSYNGGKITSCQTGEVLYQQTMPQEIVQQLFALAEELSIGMMTYNAQGIVANCHHDEYMELEAFINHMELKHYEKPLEALDGSVNKCLGTAPVAIAPQIEKKFAEHFGGRINVSRSEPFFIELVPLGVDKASSLARLCGILGCTEQDMIACGDGFNDIAMIEFAGLGIAMANAQEPVKAVADYVTRSNEEDGVAYVVERFVLGKGSV